MTLFFLLGAAIITGAVICRALIVSRRRLRERREEIARLLKQHFKNGNYAVSGVMFPTTSQTNKNQATMMEV